jgi:putative nucleotidyltransferase with HDIG domain
MATPTSARTVSASIARKLKELPVLPSDFGEMIGLDPAADDFGKRVEAIAMREPALAARLLSVANAALLGSQSAIRTLDVAIVRMGSRRVAALVTSFAAMRVFKPTTEAQRDLWRHALSCAVAAGEIAAQSRLDVDPQQAYVAGLLHDIGRFVLVDDVPVDEGAAFVPDWSRDPGPCALERAAVGIDHAEIGLAAAREWRLPRELWAAMRVHHEHGDLAGVVPEHVGRLVRVVQQADALSEFLLGPGRDAAKQPAAELAPRLAFWAVAPSWGAPPLAPESLAKLVPGICAQSGEQFGALALG